MSGNDTARLRPEDIIEALGLLTRLPVEADGTRGARAAWAWPLAGAIAAFVTGITAWLALWAGLGAMLTAALALALMIALTGAMHEDGLADCADGFWGGQERESRLAIMRDSRIGTYGVIALVLSLLARWSALAMLFSSGHVLGPLVAAAALSRVPVAAVAGWVRPARHDGLSAGTGQPDNDTVIMAALVGMILGLTFAGFAAIGAALVVAAAGWAMARLAIAKIGGQSGDVLGATQQLAEIAALAVLTASV